MHDLRRLGVWLFDVRIDLHSAIVLAVVMVAIFAATRPINRRLTRWISAASFEVALVCGLFALWQLANQVTRGHTSDGLRHGRDIWNAERWLHIPSEKSLQSLILGHSWLVRATNEYYDTMHLTGMFLFLVWLWLRHRDRYPRWRNTLALFTGMSLLVQMISVAPPRLIGVPGLVDTAARYGQSVYSVIGSGIADQYAAMPSIHVGWAVLISVAVVRCSSSRWRWLFALHGPVTIFVVVSTANHYWADGAVALALLAVAWLGSGLIERLRGVRTDPTEVPDSSVTTEPMPVPEGVSSMTRLRRPIIVIVGVMSIVASLGAATVADGTTAKPALTPVASGGTAIYAIDENLVGFNINTSAANEFVLAEILNMVTPTVYITTSGYDEVLNRQLVTSDSSRFVHGKQVVTYHLNPQATWSDGTPITADDFIYNWQAQSGRQKYKDKDGRPYDVAGTEGYNQISSVRGSRPSDGACSAGSTKDRNKGFCPNGRTIAVHFSSPFPDWRLLFGALMPAHVARRVGWNTGFDHKKNVVGLKSGFSGSWYYISKYVPNQEVILTRNPSYWDAAGRLKTIVFRILGTDSVEPPALNNGEVTIINPATVTKGIYSETRRVTGVTSRLVAGLEYEHLDFNQTNPYLRKLDVRRAIAEGTNRNELIQRTIGQIDPNIKPLGDRMFVNNQPQYVNNGRAYDSVHVAAARSLLRKSKMKLGKDGYFHPTFGPRKGNDLQFTIMSTTGNAVRAKTEQIFQSQMKNVGIKIKIHNQDADTFFGTTLPQGLYDIGEFAWVATPFVSSNQSIFCSYKRGVDCGQNWVHYANKTVDHLLADGVKAHSVATEDKDFNAADKVLWHDMVTLPLYQKPQLVAWRSKLKNVVPNGSSVGSTWNAEQWGYAGG